MPAPIVIVANVWATEESIGTVTELLTRSAAHTHENEPDAHLFAVHRDVDDPLHLTIIEAYEDQAALENHRASPVYKDLMGQLPDLLVNRERLILEPIATGDSEKASVR